MMDYAYVIICSCARHIKSYMMYFVDLLYVPYHVYSVPLFWATTYVLGGHIIYEVVLDGSACGLCYVMTRGMISINKKELLI